MPSLNTYSKLPLWDNQVDGLNIYQTSNKNDVVGATQDLVYNVNWARILGVLSNTGPPGAASALYKRPCSYWHDDPYPFGSTFDVDPQATGSALKDGSFIASPIGGWFQALQTGNSTSFDQNSISIFNANQMRDGSLYGYGPNVNAALLGTKPIAASSFTLPPTSSSLFTAATSSSGLFDTLPTRWQIEFLQTSAFSANITRYNPFPYYNYTAGTSDDMDDAISIQINSALDAVAILDKTALTTGSAAAKVRLFQKINAALKNLPYGGVYFSKIDNANRKYKWTYQYGFDQRLTGSTTFPAPGPRLLGQQIMLDNAILRTSNSTSQGTSKITHGFRLMPQFGTSAINIPFGGFFWLTQVLSEPFCIHLESHSYYLYSQSSWCRKRKVEYW